MPVSDEGIEAYKAEICTVIPAIFMPVIRFLILRLKDVTGELSDFVSRRSGRIPFSECCLRMMNTISTV